VPVQGLGVMGGGSPGKSRMTFDHVISRLREVSQRCRETGAELTRVTNDLHNALGGLLVCFYFHYYYLLDGLMTTLK
jgi:hypothetical protein